MGLISAWESRRRQANVRPRARLSRTLSRAHFTDYRSLLRKAIGYGYDLVPLERFLDHPDIRRRERILILRHDVDQAPASARAFAAVERPLGVTSTWYFRWRTADLETIDIVRSQGGEIGLHYETLTRLSLARRGTVSDPVGLIDEARTTLSAEIDVFRSRFGAIRSVAAHGDTRAPELRNLDLLDGIGPEAFGVTYDANLSIRNHQLGAWLTDRSAAEGSWGDGQDPFDLLGAGVSPILCLTHPNNWISGAGLWRDRLLAATLPDLHAGKAARVIRALPDAPPLTA